MQDSRIKILRDRPPFRIAPTESAFLQPSPPGRPSERGRFRIGDSDTEAGELAQSFAQIYEKIRHFSKFYADYFSNAIGDPNSNPQKHLAGLLAGSPCSPSARGRAETSGIGRREKPKRFREDRACPENRQGRVDNNGNFTLKVNNNDILIVHSKNTPASVSYAKRFRQAEHKSRIRPDYAETRKRPSQTDDVIRRPSRTRRVRRPTSAGRPPCRRVPWRSWRCRRGSSRSAAPDSPVRHPTRSSRRSRTNR